MMPFAPPVLRITATALDEMIAHAQRGYPDEVVGLLACQPGAAVIIATHALVNEAHGNASTRFVVSRERLAAAERQIADLGLAVAGHYHSHPNRTAECSVQDRARAPIGSPQIILAIRRDGSTVMRCWLRTNPRSVDELKIEEV